MYGDPDELDRLAAEVRQQAEGVRDQVRSRLAQSEQATWQSAAAQAWRERVREETRQGLAAADQLDEAAAALVAHAQRCRETLAEIAAIEASVKGWFSDRWNDLQAGGRYVVETGELTLRQLSREFSQLPPPGDIEWLRLRNPVISR